MNEKVVRHTHVWRAFVQSLYDRQRLTNNEMAVANWFSGWDADARIAPSHGYLARACNLCARTIRTILAKLRTLGVIRWDNRWTEPCQDTSGRPHQTSNLYERTLPEGAIEAGIPTPTAYDGKRCRQKYIPKISSLSARRVPPASMVSHADQQSAQKQLAAIAARRSDQRERERVQERQDADARETLSRSRIDANRVQSAATQPRRAWI